MKLMGLAPQMKAPHMKCKIYFYRSAIDELGMLIL